MRKFGVRSNVLQPGQHSINVQLVWVSVGTISSSKFPKGIMYSRCFPVEPFEDSAEATEGVEKMSLDNDRSLVDRAVQTEHPLAVRVSFFFVY